MIVSKVPYLDIKISTIRISQLCLNIFSHRFGPEAMVHQEVPQLQIHRSSSYVYNCSVMGTAWLSADV